MGTSPLPSPTSYRHAERSSWQRNLLGTEIGRGGYDKSRNKGNGSGGAAIIRIGRCRSRDSSAHAEHRVLHLHHLLMRSEILRTIVAHGTHVKCDLRWSPWVVATASSLSRPAMEGLRMLALLQLLLTKRPSYSM